MAVIQTLTATILIQVGADEPKPIGTIEIPIEVSTGKRPGAAYRGGSTNDVEINGVEINGPGPLGPAAPSMAATQRLINRKSNLNQL